MSFFAVSKQIISVSMQSLILVFDQMALFHRSRCSVAKQIKIFAEDGHRLAGYQIEVVCRVSQQQ